MRVGRKGVVTSLCRMCMAEQASINNESISRGCM